jgi:hypothetical protein
MNFLRQHWYDIGPVLGLAALVWAVVGQVQGLQLILLLNLVVLFLHQFEEYHWPGGFPWIFNEVVNPRGGPSDRHVLNRNNVAFINITGWLFYLVPVLLPGVIWLGIGQVLFGMVGQVIFHGIVANRKLKSWYNPGLAAVFLGHVPLGIWYLVAAAGQGAIRWSDWLFGLSYLAGFAGIVMQVIGFRLLADPASPHPLSAEEMARFDRDNRLRRLGIAPRAPTENGE